MGRRKRETFEFPGMTAEIEQLPYDLSEELMPDVWQILSAALDKLQAHSALLLELMKSHEGDEMGQALLAELPRLLPILTEVAGAVGEKLGNGKLKWLAARLFRCTRVVLSDPETGDKERVDLSKVEERAKVFETYPETYLPMVFLAGKVTYGRFFSVKGLPRSGQATTTG